MPNLWGKGKDGQVLMAVNGKQKWENMPTQTVIYIEDMTTGVGKIVQPGKDTQRVTQETTKMPEINDIIIKGREEGITCPCCGKYCKLYKRKLHDKMARFIIKLVRIHRTTDDWVHIRQLAPGSEKSASDGSYLIHWGMIKVKEKRPGEPRAGFYKPTEMGVLFAYGKISVSSHAYIYNNEVERFSDEVVTVSEALDNPFDYQELMYG